MRMSGAGYEFRLAYGRVRALLGTKIENWPCTPGQIAVVCAMLFLAFMRIRIEVKLLLEVGMLSALVPYHRWVGKGIRVIRYSRLPSRIMPHDDAVPRPYGKPETRA